MSGILTMQQFDGSIYSLFGYFIIQDTQTKTGSKENLISSCLENFDLNGFYNKFPNPTFITINKSSTIQKQASTYLKIKGNEN